MTDDETTTTTDEPAAAPEETPAPAPSRTSKTAPAAAPAPDAAAESPAADAPAEQTAPAGPDLGELGTRVATHKGWRLEMQTDAFDRPATPVARHATGMDISLDTEGWEAKLDELNKVWGYAD